MRLPDGRSFLTNEGVTALDEAIEFLKTLKPVTPLLVSKGLVLSAKLHLDDLQKSGGSGHRGTDGSKPEDRFSRFGIWQDSVGENTMERCNWIDHRRWGRDARSSQESFQAGFQSDWDLIWQTG